MIQLSSNIPVKTVLQEICKWLERSNSIRLTYRRHVNNWYALAATKCSLVNQLQTLWSQGAYGLEIISARSERAGAYNLQSISALQPKGLVYEARNEGSRVFYTRYFCCIFCELSRNTRTRTRYVYHVHTLVRYINRKVARFWSCVMFVRGRTKQRVVYGLAYYQKRYVQYKLTKPVDSKHGKLQQSAPLCAVLHRSYTWRKIEDGMHKHET